MYFNDYFRVNYILSAIQCVSKLRVFLDLEEIISKKLSGAGFF